MRHLQEGIRFHLLPNPRLLNSLLGIDSRTEYNFSTCQL